ncbi:MAG: hypothetical protein IIA05_06030 [Proteobacteria bacterium]|nr:hypothetical protein [Pseudomonadota bacterium]
MEQYKKIFFGLLFLLALIIIAWLSGSSWSPLNLIFGPQSSVHTEAPKSNSRDPFLMEIVPKRYPILVQCLQKGSETIQWVAQSGEKQQELLSFQEPNSLAIETTIFVGTAPNSSSSSTQQVLVTMIDSTGDAKMDQVVYLLPGGQTHKYTEPFDEASQFLWDSGLAMAFKLSKCF